MSAPRHIAAMLGLAAALALAACSRDSWPDAPLAAPATIPGDQLAQAISGHDGDTVLVVSFSGGGVRASALAYGVLRELDRDRPTDGGSLLDDVAVVSSVSGGSVTAGWFALHGKSDWARLERFLYTDNMREMTLRALNPLRAVKVLSPNVSRIDLEDHYFRDMLFGEATMGDVARRDGPLVILNATDMSAGQVFPFTQDMFDSLCADLSQFPVATAVTASAAFPIALTPVTLKNHSGLPECTAPPAPSTTVREGLTPGEEWLALERLKRARWLDSMRRHTATGADAPYRPIDYVHLLDGGLADNLGQTSLAQAFVDRLGLLTAKGKTRLVWIVVNARSDAPSGLDRDGDTPGEIAQISAVTSVPIDGKSAATAGLVANTLAWIDADLRAYHQTCRTLGSDGCARLYPFGPPQAPVVYRVTVDFDQIPDAQRDLRNRLKTSATSWTLPKSTIDELIASGGTLLRAHPCFQRLLEDTGVAAPTLTDAELKTFCPLSSDD